MKAILITKPGGPNVLKLTEMEDPKPGLGEVLVRVYATGLNRGELLQRRGLYPPPPGVREDIPGVEFAGVVETLGPNVHLFKKGDRVMGILPGGGYAEKVVTPEAMAIPIPKKFGFEEAAAIPEVFLTAYDALFNQLELKRGEKILIHAIGSGVGLAALQLAKQAGGFVLGTSSSDEKLKRAKDFGLDVAINYKTEDFEKVVKEVETILDFVGAPYLEKHLNCLAIKGRLVLVGLLGGRESKINLDIILRKRLKIIGTVLRTRPLEEKIALTQTFIKKVLPSFEQGIIKPVIDSVFPLTETPKAHAYMEANKNFGKIILKVI